MPAALAGCAVGADGGLCEVCCLKRLVYLAPVPLNSPSQRPHHFVQWAHERLGCEIWWVEPYPVRLPRPGDLRRLGAAARKARHGLGPAWRDAPWLHVLAAPSLPVEPLPGGAPLVGWMQRDLRARLQALLQPQDAWLAVGRPSGLALALCTARRGLRVLYDVMDDMPQFSRGLSRRWMVHAHEEVLAQAQAVWGSSEHIVQALQGRTRQPATLVRNGVVLPPVPPHGAGPDQGVGSAAHAHAPLVLGYVGTIAAWFDWQALRQLAQALPQAQLHIYGPLECVPPPTLPPNVQLLGPVPHAQVFTLMRSWHAGLIPFVRNTLTRSVDPVKYYEYRACGLPVLTTLFGEMPYHAAADDGVWSLESLALPELEARLRGWHGRLAERHAQGQPLAPGCLQGAGWATRFEEGAAACGWLQGNNRLPGAENKFA